MSSRHAKAPDRSLGAMPEFWSQSDNPAGGTVLSYAVRSGAAYYGLIAFGAVLVLYCASVAFRWLTEAELGISSILVTLIIPGSGVLIGLRCLDVALRARTDYTLTKHGLIFRDQSLFGSKALEIPREKVIGVHQQYSPPGPSSAQSAPGEWTTFLSYKDAKTGKQTDLAFLGMCTPEEARWLGPLVAEWAGKPLKRGFSAENVEADPDELPKL